MDLGCFETYVNVTEDHLGLLGKHIQKGEATLGEYSRGAADEAKVWFTKFWKEEERSCF